MIKAGCHCGAVRLTLDPAPNWVLDCNCSICSRYGALWAYPWDGLGKRNLSATIVQGADAIDAYIWGGRRIGFWRCRSCGCLTHHTALASPTNIRGINARLFVNFDPASVTIHRSDSAHTGRFWTRPDAPILDEPRQPMSPLPPNDWR